ncbi:MAG: phytanoyl-CoA dioxygenase family protein [Gammaproteobacteria bacterium]|nr:phytanoyl-CoA dioxygenase family protein [Gammaproteobacteria bacterium]
MDRACLEHRLTDAERREFDERGCFVVRDALPPALVSRLATAVDRLEAEYRPLRNLGPAQPLNHLDCIGYDDAFLELLEWPKTIARVIDILGWHIQLYHSHLIVTPPLPTDHESHSRLHWHQDSGRLNLDLESNPRPRVSLKVGFFLTDTSEPDRGNFHIVPGSHLCNALEFPQDGAEHPDATPVCARAGDAVFFDRRLWHAAGRNRSDVTRKVIFLGYSYRWLRPRDDMTVGRYLEDADPIRRQLLGESPTGGFGYTSPSEEDVPLRAWLVEHLGEDAVVR